MSPKRFRTAVLCRYQAGGDFGSTLAFLGWLLDLVRPAKVDLVLARGSGKPEVRPVRSAFLEPLREALADAAVESVRLSVPETGGMGYRLSFFLETRRGADLAEYLRFLYPDAPKQADEADRVKLVACSLAQSVVSDRLKRQGERLWIEHWKRMFADLGAAAGYRTGTDLPLTSVFTLSPGQPGVRIYDVDYRTHLDGVYEDNLLSRLHLLAAPDLRERLEADGTLETEPVEDREGGLRGLLVRPGEGSPWGARRLASLLGDLVHRPPQGTERSFLLLSRDEVAAMGNVLKAEMGAARALPHGFVQIEEPAMTVPEDSLKRTSRLNRLFGPVHPAVRSGKVFAHELMERFPGLFDRRSAFFRIPTGKARGRSLFVYFASPEPDLESLEMHLLAPAGLAPADVERVRTVAEAWLAGVAEHPGSYGEIEPKDAVAVRERPGGMDVHWQVNASRLRQEGVSLLVMLVDELNRERFRIPYLVFGSIPEPWSLDRAPCASEEDEIQ